MSFFNEHLLSVNWTQKHNDIISVTGNPLTRWLGLEAPLEVGVDTEEGMEGEECPIMEQEGDTEDSEADEGEGEDLVNWTYMHTVHYIKDDG